MLSCEENEAQYIQCNDECYHAAWMVPETKENSEYITLDVIEIEKDLYDALYTIIENNEELPSVEEENTPTVDEYVDPMEQATIEFAIKSKIDEMSYMCNKSICDGFDVMLSDGANHHFSMTMQDQFNLMNILTLAQSNADSILYHADNEPVKAFSSDDIYTICNAANYHKTYHTTYYNSLKAYISSLTDIDNLKDVSYGMNIPTEFRSTALQDILLGNINFDNYSSNTIYKDEDGNKYKMFVDTDGTINTSVIETNDGELFM